MPPITGTLLALGAVVAIAIVDANTGSRLAFSPLYAVPITLAAWHLGPRIGIVVAVGAAISRLVSELAWHDPDLLLAWSALAWGALFVASARFVAWGRARREQVASLDERVTELLQIEHGFARTDPLTSLCNRRAFVDALQQAEARARRGGGSLAVARLDIDGFTALNERYSREGGDQLLRAVATSLSLTTRMGDVASRLEDDEFAILLYGCAVDDAQRVGERLVAEVAELGRAYPDVSVTASVGIVCFSPPGPDPDEMLRLAGTAMRRARQAGGGTAVLERQWSAIKD